MAKAGCDGGEKMLMSDSKLMFGMNPGELILWDNTKQDTSQILMNANS